MNIHIEELHLTFKKGRETVEFRDFTYLYGPMGAGKSTIARLVDYCLGGNIGEDGLTPALQSEFLSAGLSLKVEECALDLRRDVGSNLIRASFHLNDEPIEVMIPARKAAGEVIPNSGVEVLSDLVYVLGGKTPPKVRKSQICEDSELARLSLRDLLWYCYLDQDHMDSSFFHLERDADFNKRLKSRDVLRFLVGFHQERVSELEVVLELKRTERLKSEAGVEAIKEALTAADIATEIELQIVRGKLEMLLSGVEFEIKESREKLKGIRPHAMDSLQTEARTLSMQIARLEQAGHDLQTTREGDRAHRNELLSLSTRFRRSQSAREVLSGVSFEDCPQCGRGLPQKPEGQCQLCGQIEAEDPTGVIDEESAQKDLDARVSELSELIRRHDSAIERNSRLARELLKQKRLVDDELDRVAKDYDSAYLSSSLELEKKRAAVRQEIADLSRIELLVQRIGELNNRVVKLTAEEKEIRAALKQAREKAEQNTKNIQRLKVLFLDCLLKAKLSGFYSDDIVDMKPPYFLPEVTSAGSGDLAVTSFSNLGSGGKKTLFKCCFAVAVHRLAAEVGAILPSLLIIDSPMKNTSERQNREQFEGFIAMLYELSESELKETQFIVVDKELLEPPESYSRSFSSRKMQPNERGQDPSKNPYPPLIPYYQDK